MHMCMCVLQVKIAVANCEMTLENHVLKIVSWLAITFKDFDRICFVCPTRNCAFTGKSCIFLARDQ